jgi:DNA mismatch repair protein MSH5
MISVENAVVRSHPHLRGIITVSFMPQVCLHSCSAFFVIVVIVDAALHDVLIVMHMLLLPVFCYYCCVQVGFLVDMPNNRIVPSMLPEEFDFVFTEEDISFFKIPAVQQLDQSVGDLDGQIKDIETIIVAELEELILDNQGDLLASFSAFAELDCIMAFANSAVDLHLTRPVMLPREEKCIEIVNGRHPLQEIVLDGDFVPNDTSIDYDSRVNIITGPNYSGKSCYARQVGVIVYMAHLGSFVPCDTARISVVESILAKFSAIETCSVPQSSFQLDLTSMGTILRRAGPNSLVIVDEFGKGASDILADCDAVAWLHLINIQCAATH